MRWPLRTKGRCDCAINVTASDGRPLEPHCPCAACQHSRGYLHHLFKAGEMLGPILLTTHNLTYYQRLMREIREAIEAGEFAAYFQRKMAGWKVQP